MVPHIFCLSSARTTHLDTVPGAAHSLSTQGAEGNSVIQQDFEVGVV